MENEIQKIKLFDGSFGELMVTPLVKAFKSEKYNYLFFKENGEFYRWGSPENQETPKKLKNPRFLDIFSIWVSLWGKENVLNFKEFLTSLEDDGDLDYSVPEILDWEIADQCEGVPGIGPCKFCYKSNVGHKGNNITFEDFKETFQKLPPTITQIAYGCGTLRLHPEMWDIFQYTKDNGIIPNLTINGDVDDDEFDKIAELCGACSVSIYDKELSYDAIKKLTDRGMTQVNIHYMISNESYDKAFEIMDDIKKDPRLEKLGALVLLSLKLKGRAVKNNFTSLSQEKFNNIFQYALDNEISIGMDSCSAAKTLNFVETNSNYDYMKTYIEPCESSCYSAYISTKSHFFPCSFSEGEGEWKEGLDVKNCNDFIDDIWHNEKTKRFGDGVKKCRACNKGCPIFEV